MSAEYLSAWASVGTLVVVIATATAAVFQLRHMSMLNGLTVLNDFRQEYERIEAAAFAAVPLLQKSLEDASVREAIAAGGPLPEVVRPALPLIRLFEILGSYTNRGVVAHEVVTDQWAPVVVRWWSDFEPFIVLFRRHHGPTLLEGWEALVVRSKRVLERQGSSYPKSLPRLQLVDPWASESSEAL